MSDKPQRYLGADLFKITRGKIYAVAPVDKVRTFAAVGTGNSGSGTLQTATAVLLVKALAGAWNIYHNKSSRIGLFIVSDTERIILAALEENMSLTTQKYLAILGACKEIAGILQRYNIDTFEMGESSVLPKPIAGHADMLCAVTAEERVITGDRLLLEALQTRGIVCAEPSRIPCGQYPSDVCLNAMQIGNCLVANTKYCLPELLESARKRKLKILHVNQGYTRCSTAAISENAVITADSGIAQTLAGEGFDVLHISPGGIELPGYNYGFIGGCCARLPKCSDVVFSGNPKNHPDGNRICDFIRSHHCDIIASDDGPLRDIGGVVFIKL